MMLRVLLVKNLEKAGAVRDVCHRKINIIGFNEDLQGTW